MAQQPNPFAEAQPAPAHRRVSIPIRLRVTRPPPRHRRLLLDTFHSSAYPAGFFPTDDLSTHAEEMMDSKGDDLLTNFRALAAELRASGFALEVLRSDWTTSTPPTTARSC